MSWLFFLFGWPEAPESGALDIVLRENPPGGLNIAFQDLPQLDIVLRDAGAGTLNIAFTATVRMDLAETAAIADAEQSGVIRTMSLTETADISEELVRVVNPFTPYVVANIEVGAGPFGVADDLDSVWVANYGGSSLSQIDPETFAVIDTVTLPPGSGPVQPVFDGMSIWVTLAQARRFVRINLDRAPHRPTAVEVLPSYPKAVVFDGTSLWVATNAASLNGERLITVTNPSPGGGTSEPATLVVTGADPSPVPS